MKLLYELLETAVFIAIVKLTRKHVTLCNSSLILVKASRKEQNICFHQFVTGSGSTFRRPTFASSSHGNITAKICCKTDKRQFCRWQPLDILWTLACFRVEKLALLLLLSLSLLHSPPTHGARSWIQQVYANQFSWVAGILGNAGEQKPKLHVHQQVTPGRPGIENKNILRLRFEQNATENV